MKDCAQNCAHEEPKRPHESQREQKFACRQLCGSAENMGKVGVMYERLAVRRSRVRIPSAPPFDARGKLSTESFPRFVYPERRRGVARVEWCPERGTEVRVEGLQLRGRITPDFPGFFIARPLNHSTNPSRLTHYNRQGILRPSSREY